MAREFLISDRRDSSPWNVTHQNQTQWERLIILRKFVFNISLAVLRSCPASKLNTYDWEITCSVATHSWLKPEVIIICALCITVTEAAYTFWYECVLSFGLYGLTCLVLFQHSELIIRRDHITPAVIINCSSLEARLESAMAYVSSENPIITTEVWMSALSE